ARDGPSVSEENTRYPTHGSGVCRNLPKGLPPPRLESAQESSPGVCGRRCGGVPAQRSDPGVLVHLVVRLLRPTNGRTPRHPSERSLAGVPLPPEEVERGEQYQRGQRDVRNRRAGHSTCRRGPPHGALVASS